MEKCKCNNNYTKISEYKTGILDFKEKILWCANCGNIAIDSEMEGYLTMNSRNSSLMKRLKDGIVINYGNKKLCFKNCNYFGNKCKLFNKEIINDNRCKECNFYFGNIDEPTL